MSETPTAAQIRAELADAEASSPTMNRLKAALREAELREMTLAQLKGVIGGATRWGDQDLIAAVQRELRVRRFLRELNKALPILDTERRVSSARRLMGDMT